MNKEEKKIVIDRYSNRLKEHGATPKALGWDKGRHFLRYHVLLSMWELSKETKLLDFGCGFGDLYEYLIQNDIELIYEGVDINEDLIKAGKEIHPNANLKCLDFLNLQNADVYDFIISSGVHNLKLEQNWEFIEKTFEQFYKCSKKGFSINFISNQIDPEFSKEHLYYSDPSKILNLAYKYSNRVILRNDYMPFEFTLFIFKEDVFDKNKVVYPSFIDYCE